MPEECHDRVAQALFAFINTWLVNLLADEAVPAFNMYGLFRLADDLASIQALADAEEPPGLAVSLCLFCRKEKEENQKQVYAVRRFS